MKKQLVSSTLGVAFAAVLAGPAMAQPDYFDDQKTDEVAFDPFLSGDARGNGEYTASTDMRTMGAAAFGFVGTAGVDGFGISHSGSTGNFVANALGNDAAAVDYEQGGRMQWLGVGNFPFDRNLERQLNPTVSSNEWYISGVLNRLGWADSATNTYAVGGFTDGANNGIQFGYDDQIANDNNPDLAVRVGGQNFIVAADAASSVNQYVLTKLTINESGDDTIEVWVNQDPTALGVADLTITSINLTDSTTPFTQSRYESPGQSGAVFFDEMLLTTSLDAAANPFIPEPTSLALLGLGGLGLLARRRRQA